MAMVFYCDSNNGCERACGGLEKCVEECSNFHLKNNLKNNFDMHKCAVRVITKVMLSNVEDTLPVQLFIEGIYRSSSIFAVSESRPTRIKLSLQAHVKVIAARHAHYSTGVKIAVKILVLHNNANEADLELINKTSKDSCSEQQLKRLIERDDNRLYENIGPWSILDELVTNELKAQGKVLYYQCPVVLASENNGKYDLNNEKAPVIAMVVEDCNKENHYTTQLLVQAVQENILCNNPNCMHEYRYIDLPNGKGFWCLRLVHGTILCWFHIMSTLGKHLKIWKVDWSLRYPIAMVFKIVGQSRSDEDVSKMKKEYNEFICSLPLDNDTKNFLMRDLKMNWICEEWRQ
ncbi:7631_t:CDS:2, partial [Gigaspora rosea]